MLINLLLIVYLWHAFVSKETPSYYPDHRIPLDTQPFTSVSAGTLGRPFESSLTRNDHPWFQMYNLQLVGFY